MYQKSLPIAVVAVVEAYVVALAGGMNVVTAAVILVPATFPATGKTNHQYKEEKQYDNSILHNGSVKNVIRHPESAANIGKISSFF